MKVLLSVILCVGFYGWYRSFRKRKKRNYGKFRYPYKSKEIKLKPSICDWCLDNKNCWKSSTRSEVPCWTEYCSRFKEGKKEGQK